MTAARVPVVPTALALRWALLRGALRPGPGAIHRRIGCALGAAAGAVLAAVALIGLTAARGHGALPVDLATLLFAGLLIGWVTLPLLTFGSDDLLDPTRLALLPLTSRQLVTVIGAGALVGTAPIATFLAALGLVPATASGPWSSVVAVVAVVLQLMLCVSLSRACAAALSGVLRSRRGRDAGVALTALLAVGSQVPNLLLQRSGPPDAQVVAAVAGPLRWTPPGLLAAAPTRPLPLAVASLVAVAVLVGAVTWWWARCLRRALERPDTGGGRHRRGSYPAPPAARRLLPTGRVGAVAAKDLRYLVRDPRRLVSLVSGVLVPVAAVVVGPIVVADGRPPDTTIFAAGLIALFVGYTAANRFGLDGSAVWQLLSSESDRRDARRDLLGGDVAVSLLGLAVTAVVVALLAALVGPRHLPAAVGLALALLAVSVALSGLVAVSAPYAVPETTNAFGAGGGGQGCSTGLVTLGGLLGSAALCLPLLALVVPALSRPLVGFALLAVGPVYGLAVGAWLRTLATRTWVRRGPEILHIVAGSRSR